jgi:aerobic carbon-monoxide dehydrogenase medium subunit
VATGRDGRTRSLPDAVKLLDPDDATVRAIAGRTALMLMMKAGVFRPGGW